MAERTILPAWWLKLHIKVNEVYSHRPSGWNRNRVFTIHICWIAKWISWTFQCAVYQNATFWRNNSNIKIKPSLKAELAFFFSRTSRGHSALSRPELEPGSSDSEPSALTIALLAPGTLSKFSVTRRTITLVLTLLKEPSLSSFYRQFYISQCLPFIRYWYILA